MTTMTHLMVGHWVDLEEEKRIPGGSVGGHDTVRFVVLVHAKQVQRASVVEKSAEKERRARFRIHHSRRAKRQKERKKRIKRHTYPSSSFQSLGTK
jgi:hypothetical protein